jgi:chemotaxis protein methyltransferase CheR
MSGHFKVFFCRNLVIYFDKPTQKVLFDRFSDLLAPGGYIFIGHAESMYNPSERFTSIGNTMYRKTK